jgi:Flp pilus assembly pilin Flp
MALHGWIDRLRSRLNRSEGQTMAEYAVVLGVIVPAIVLAYSLFSDDIGRLIDSVRAIFG